MSCVPVLSIYWCEFDWQSFATLATGLAAVTGASVVGLRQIAITRRQAEVAESQNRILERQTALAELTLRHDLFDRRAEIFEATRAFLGEILAHAQPPSRETQNRFLLALNTSRLLFRPEVHRQLEDIWKRGAHFEGLCAEMRTTYTREGHYGDGNPDREFKALTAFNQDLVNLVDLFGEEIRLSV